MMSGTAPVAGKIVLKSTTSTSLNDRFTRVMKSSRSTKHVSLNEASLKNQRLAEQMGRRSTPKPQVRPIPIASPSPPKKQPSLKSRLTSTSKSPKSRLGVVQSGGGGIISAPIAPPLQRISTRPWMRGGAVARPQAAYSPKLYVSGGGGRNQRGGLAISRGTFRGQVTPGRGRATPGRGRGAASRGIGRGQSGAVTASVKSKVDLDKELDEYMVRSAKIHL